MNAEETVAKIRKRYDVTLPSGMAVTIRIPPLRECVLAGKVPLPVLGELQKKMMAGGNGDEPETTLEDARQLAAFQEILIMKTLVAIEGEPVTMTPEAVAELDQDDYNELVSYGWRTKSPLAPAPA
jgi:hypothetical protein